MNILPSRILQESPTGSARAVAYSRYLDHLDKLAGRVDGVSDTELKALIDEACDQARQSHS